MASKKKTISAPRRSSAKKSKNPSMQTILFVVVGLFAILFGVWAVSSRGRSFNLRSGAWDCARYNFTVKQNGEVLVENFSAKNEPATGVEVYIDNVLVQTLKAPALASGQTAIIGKVAVPASGIFTWRAEAVVDRRCVDTGSYKEAANVCNVAYISTKQNISASGTTGGYLPYQFVATALNGVANVARFDLYTSSLPSGALDKVDLVIMSDWSTQKGGYNPPAAELLTSGEIQTIKTAYQQGLSVVVVGDNGKPVESTTIVDAAASIIPLVNGLQGSWRYNTNANYVPQVNYQANAPVWGPEVAILKGVKINTVSSAYSSPGWITPVSGKPGTCMYLTPPNATSQACIVAYLPPTSGSGFLVIDGNAGFPMKTSDVLKRVAQEACRISKR